MQLTYTINIGITGKRYIANPQEISDVISSVFNEIMYEINSTHGIRNHEYKLHLYSGLAPGADTIAVDTFKKAFAHFDYTAVLPLREKDYLADFVELEERSKLLLLLNNAKYVMNPSSAIAENQRPNCYLQMGKKIADYCDALIAVEDYTPGGIGGTSDIVNYCRLIKKPIWTINANTGTYKSPSIRLDLKLQEELKIYNQTIDSCIKKGYNDLFVDLIEAQNMNYIFKCLDELAAVYQDAFLMNQRGRLLAAFAAVLFSALGLFFELSSIENLSHITHFLELASLLLVAGLYIIEARKKFQEKWVRFRQSAELMRIIIFAKCCNIDVSIDPITAKSTFFYRFQNQLVSSISVNLTYEECSDLIKNRLIDDQLTFHNRKLNVRRKNSAFNKNIGLILFILLIVIVLTTTISAFNLVALPKAPHALLLLGIVIPALFSYIIASDALMENKKILLASEQALQFFIIAKYDIEKIKSRNLLIDLFNRIKTFMLAEVSIWNALYEAEKNEMN